MGWSFQWGNLRPCCSVETERQNVGLIRIVEVLQHGCSLLRTWSGNVMAWMIWGTRFLVFTSLEIIIVLTLKSHKNQQTSSCSSGWNPHNHGDETGTSSLKTGISGNQPWYGKPCVAYQNLFSGWEIVLPLLECLKKPAMQQPNQDFPKWQSPSHKLHGFIYLHDPIWLGNFRLNLGKYIYWLVVEPNRSEKYVSSSVGMMTFPTEWKVIKFMFQTTNQYIYRVHLEHHGLSF